MTEKHRIKIFDSQEVKNLVSMSEAIDAMREAFLDLKNGDAEIPLRTNISIQPEKSTALFMPGYLKTRDLIGIKTVTVFKDNYLSGLPAIHGVIQIFNGKTGEPLAILDGEYITALRTGAVSGLVTDLLASKNASTVCIYGTGVQGATQLQAINEVRNISNVFVFDINRERAENFIENESVRYSFEIKFLENQEMLKDIDIICTSTNSAKPLFDKNMLKENCHINAIGGYKPEMCELPADLFADSFLVVDNIEAVLNESGEIINAIQNGYLKKESVNKTPGDIITEGYIQNNNKRTIFKSVGLAIQDIAIAGLILEKTKNSENLREINL